MNIMHITRRSRTLLRISLLAVFSLLMLLGSSERAFAQWTTNGSNINNTNTGNVGIGTTAPQAKLEVHHSSATTDPINVTLADIPFAVRNTSNTNGNFSIISFIDSVGYGNAHIGAVQTNQTTHSADLFFSTRNAGTFAEKLRIKANGNVGIGTTGPTYKLQVSGNGGTAGDSLLVTDSNTTTTAVDIANTSSGAKKWRLQSVGSGVSGRVGNFELVQIESDLKALVVQPGGKVGIGTTNPSKTLDVLGDINASGTITGGTIVAKYQDVAEWVPATRVLLPGTVVTLNPTQSNLVEASAKAYDTSVAGVISAQPGITLGERSENKVLVATTGRVRVKVDATNAPIRIGDLLVTSEQEGVAMKSEPVDVGGVKMHRPGTIIGKALEPLAKGQGEILVLLSLQ